MAMFETKRPEISMGAASFTRQGVRDVGKEAFADLLIKAGGAAWEANVQSKVGATQAGVEEEITAFTEQATRKNQAVIEAQRELMTAGEEARFEEDGETYSFQPSAEETRRVEEAKTQLARVQRARASGVISEQEMRAKIDKITRQGISLMPGRTQDFIAAKRESLGLYEGDIMLERERQSVLEAAASASATQAGKDLDFAYTQAAARTGYSLTDAKGNLIPKQEYLRLTSTLNQDIGLDKAASTGTAIDQRAALENPATFDRVANSRLSSINAGYQAIKAIDVDPQTGKPLSIEDKLLQLDRLKNQQLLELSRNYFGAVDTPQYTTLQGVIESQFTRLENNLSGKTASDNSGNLANSANNAITLGIYNDPQLREYAILQQALGSNALTSLQLPQVKVLLEAAQRMSEGIGFGPEGSASSNARQAVAVLAAKEITNEYFGGKWDGKDKQGGLDLLNNYFANTTITEPKTMYAVAEYLSDPKVYELVKDLDPNAVLNMKSTMADYLTDSMLSSFAGLYDTRKVTMSVSSTGIAFINKDNQTSSDDMAKLQYLAGRFNDMSKGMAHLQGTQNYEDSFEALGSVINNIAETSTLSKAEAEKERTQYWEDFKGWIIHGGRGATGRTFEEYKQMKAKESVPKNETPAVNEVVDGFTFMGGDAGNQANWKRVQ